MVLGTNIAVLLDCSKSCLDSVAFLTYFILTYLLGGLVCDHEAVFLVTILKLAKLS